jgi:hypothetical protein
LIPELELFLFFDGFIYPFIIAIIILLFYLFEFHWMPREARELRTAKRKKRIVNIRATDEGYVDIVAAEKFTSTVLQNPDKSFSVLPASATVPPFDFTGDPSKLTADELEKLLKNARAKQRRETEAIDKINELVTKPFTLQGTGTPVWMSYTPKAVAVNPSTVAAMGNPGLFKLDPTRLKTFFRRMWNNSRLIGVAMKSEQIGVLKEKKRHDRFSQLLPIIIILALVFGVVALFLVAG